MGRQPRRRGLGHSRRLGAAEAVERGAPLAAARARADRLAGAEAVADARERGAVRDLLEALGRVKADRVPGPVDARVHRAVRADDVVAVRIGAAEESLVPAVAEVLGTVDAGPDPPEAPFHAGDQA